jgi:hypothetical protein
LAAAGGGAGAGLKSSAGRPVPGLIPGPNGAAGPDGAAPAGIGLPGAMSPFTPGSFEIESCAHTVLVHSGTSTRITNGGFISSHQSAPMRGKWQRWRYRTGFIRCLLA